VLAATVSEDDCVTLIAVVREGRRPGPGVRGGALVVRLAVCCSPRRRDPQIKLVQVGFGQVQVDVGPEAFRCLRFEVSGQDALGGQPDLEFLPTFLVAGVCVLGCVLARRLIIRWGVGHPEVSADHVDDGLSLGRVVLCQAFQRVQTAEPDRGLLGAELIDRAGVELGDALFGGVSLGGCGDLALVLQGLALVFQGSSVDRWRRAANSNATAPPAPTVIALAVRIASSCTRGSAPR